MSSIIVIKRGNEKNLDNLSLAELAFTGDTNCLFIGSMSQNINMSPIGKNILFNSNFQVPVESTDTGTNTLSQGSGRYIFGNYYLYNSNSSAGALNYNSPTVTNTYLSLSPYTDSCIPSISYYVKLPPNNDTPLENTVLTLSFDTKSTQTINFNAGTPNNLVNGTVPIGTNRNIVTFTFQTSTLSGRTAPSINFVLFSAVTPLNAALSIGNFKIELGSNATPYCANSLNYDISMMKNFYYKYYDVQRVSFITSSAMYFYFPFFDYNTNTPPVITKNQLMIYDLKGTPFYPDSSINFNSDYGCIELYCSTVPDLYTDGSAYVILDIDNRV